MTFGILNEAVGFYLFDHVFRNKQKIEKREDFLLAKKRLFQRHFSFALIVAQVIS